MILASALDRNTVYIVIAVLVFVVVVFAVVKGRSVKLWFKKSGLQVGEAPKSAPGQPASDQNVNVLNHGNVRHSTVNVDVGNKVNYGGPRPKGHSSEQ